MLLHAIHWDGDDVVIEMYDVDGEHTTFRLDAPDALDVVMWLTQERHKILEIVRSYNRRIGKAALHD